MGFGSPRAADEHQEAIGDIYYTIRRHCETKGITGKPLTEAAILKHVPHKPNQERTPDVVYYDADWVARMFVEVHKYRYRNKLRIHIREMMHRLPQVQEVFIFYYDKNIWENFLDPSAPSPSYSQLLQLDLSIATRGNHYLPKGKK
jgi:hypothetical protein